MSKPNFFIVGAPKCGTTSLSEYLRSHPKIFVSTPKELNYFRDGYIGQYRHAETLDEYLEFFKDCSSECLAVGEASPVYLSSPAALKNIREFDENAKIIIMLRNPVDLAYSLHSTLRVVFFEDEPDFEKAWRLQDSRKKGENMPKTCPNPFILQYSDLCHLGNQVEEAFKIFPREQILLIVFDDLMASTQNVYENVLSFLGVPSDGRTQFNRANESKRVKRWWLGYLYALVRETEPLNSVITWIKKSLGLKDLGIRALTRKVVPVKRPPLRPEFRAELVSVFREDVDKLSRIIGRDLSHWHQ